LALAFAPLDKRAMGLAFGVVFAFALAVVTAVSMAVDPDQRFPLRLLSEYFVGYAVSLPGYAAALRCGKSVPKRAHPTHAGRCAAI